MIAEQIHDKANFAGLKAAATKATANTKAKRTIVRALIGGSQLCPA